MMNLLLSLLLASSVLQAAPKKHSFSEYWKATSVTFKDLEERVSDKDCVSDVEDFLGCVHAINAVLAYGKPALGLMPDSIAASRADIKAVVGQYGPLKVVELKKNPELDKTKSLAEIVARHKKERNEYLAVLTDEFKTNPRIVPFEAALAFAKGKAPIADKEAEIAAQGINEWLSATKDPHSRIVPAAYFEDEMSPDQEKFFGIGAILQDLRGEILVQQPMEGSPALAAGLRAGDVLLEVDGQPVSGKSLQDVVDLVRGPKNSPVKLKIRRKGQILPLTIVRGEIVSPPNVISKMLADRDEKIGYVKLQNFMEKNGCDLVKRAVVDLEKQGARGLMLDLRGNGGGLIDQAVCIANVFVGPGKVVVEEREIKSGALIRPFATAQGATTALPLITLVDAGSASASEIVSGALQDHQRGYLLGDRTFGKGSVQISLRVRSMPGVNLLITVARFYRPSGRTNQVVGITPDFTVASKPNPTPDDLFAVREEDLYTNALPPMGEPWIQPRPAEIAGIENCVKDTHQADKIYASREADPIPPDYQVLAAEDAMACILAR